MSDQKNQTPDRQLVAEQLEQARELLLDLTLRNRLLNFRPTRRTTVPIIDERVEHIWELLYGKGRTVSFKAREEHPAADPETGRLPKDLGQQKDTTLPPAANRAADDSQAGESQKEGEPSEGGPTFSLPEADTALEEDERREPARHYDRFLQTPLDGPNLQKNLMRTAQAASSALQEKGSNFLFLALGFLRWQREDKPDKDILAPVLLLPVKLERSSIRGRFRLRCLDDDPVINPCLRALLERNYGLALPQEPENFDEFKPLEYLNQTREIISEHNTWRMEEMIQLGLFSFTKYLMYLDLDPQRWDGDAGLLHHPLIASLCGTVAPEQKEKTPAKKLPGLDQIHPAETFCALDADSSQFESILAASRGESFVIEGPPGTGKSQTITNLIAECLAGGKKVLFVSEKLAALEVVKRRLDKVGLGDFCLELHSTKANRKAVMAQMGRALEKGRLADPVDRRDADKLDRVRGELNDYVEQLHQPIEPTGFSPYQLMGQLLELGNLPTLKAKLPGFEEWDQNTIEGFRDLLGRLGRRLEQVYPPDKHPFCGVGIPHPDGRRIESARETLEDFEALLAEALQAGDQVAQELQAPKAKTQEDHQRLSQLAEHFLSSPGVPLSLLKGSTWDKPNRKALALIERLKKLREERSWARDRYQTSALDQVDWQQIHRRYRNNWVSWVRVFRPGYWNDRRTLHDASKEGYRPKYKQAMSDLDHLSRLSKLKSKLADKQQLGKDAFGPFWLGPSSDPGVLTTLSRWLHKARRAVLKGQVGENAIEFAAEGAYRDGLSKAARKLKSANNAWSSNKDKMVSLLSLNTEEAFGCQLEQMDSHKLRERLNRMLHRFESLHDWIHYRSDRQTVENGPLASFLKKFLQSSSEAENLGQAFDKHLAQVLLEWAQGSRKSLARFDGRERGHVRQLHAELDRDWLTRSSLRLQARLSRKRPATAFGAADSSMLGILLGEIRRKRGGRSIRKVLADAAELVLRIKPCFMMSPLSVAQFLSSGTSPFDLVVFDEASQVEPADALGAIARARQLILVGDSNQLPPTGFFKSLSGEGHRPRETETGAASIADMESILDRGAMVLPRRSLRWHFRSRHDSLIAFSNQAFYENRLMVFPACHRQSPDLGLQVEYHPEDLYDRGASQTNPEQARRIARWVFEHARVHPELSLGVGAFSRNQQQAILDQVEQLRIADDSLEEFFSDDSEEPFFVKNLETIQGDERDVIVLSIGYGKKTPDERLSMNFGPLNQDGGWRRLNVLITRAKKRCVIFSSIRPEDFRLGATKARGVHSLCDYLDFAFSKEKRIARAGAKLEDPVQRWVHSALLDRGLTLGTQVGLCGQPIPLAVRDESDPQRYVLGLEFDGPAYRDSSSARDRDRLRQQVLEGLGWRFQRIWTPDWLHQPEQQIERLLAAVSAAARGELKAEFANRPGQQKMPKLKRMESPGEEFGFVPYKIFEPERAYKPDRLYHTSAKKLAALLVDIVALEGPIHKGALLKRLADCHGISRVGSKVRERGLSALALARSDGRLKKVGPFIWPFAMEHAPVRHRADEDLRDVALISHEELGRATVSLLRVQCGMSRSDLVVQTARALGFSVTGSRIAAAVEEAIEREIGAGRIVVQDDLLQAAEQQDPQQAAETDQKGSVPGKSTAQAKAKMGQRHCLSCKTALKPGARFCPECGTPISRSCRQCGRQLEKRHKFCPECGSRT